MKIVFKIIVYILLIVFLLLSGWHFFETTCYLVVKNYKLYLWFAIGATAYFVLRRIPFYRKNEEWFQVQTHEGLHTIVAWMFGQKIHAVSAGENSGVMYHSGRFSRNIFISLAPYCLPVYTYLFCILRLLSAQQSLYIFDLLIGLTLAFHAICFKKQTSPYQTDIREFGLATSYLFIAAFLFFNVSIILLSIKYGVWIAFGKLFSQYWHDLTMCWNQIH